MILFSTFRFHRLRIDFTSSTDAVGSRPARMFAVVGVFVLALALLAAGAAPSFAASSWYGSLDNPAASGKTKFELVLPSFQASFGNNTWPLSKLDYYLDKELPLSVRQEFVADIPGSFRLDGGGVTGLELGIGGFSASVGLRGAAAGGVAKDVVELLFLGNELNRSYSLSGTSFGTALVADASVGWAMSVAPGWRAGIRWHHLTGLAYAEALVEGSGKLVYEENKVGAEGDVAIEYAYAYAEDGGGAGAGSGSAFDLGAAWEARPGLTVGFSVLDIGQLQWASATRGRCEVNTGATGSGGTGAGSGGSGAGGSGDDPFQCTDTVGPVVWQLPVRYEASVGWQATNKIHVAGVYTAVGAGGAFAGTGIAAANGLRGTVTWDVFKFLQLNATAYLTDGFSLSTGGALKLGPVRLRARLNNVQALFGQGGGRSVGFGADFGIAF